MVFQPVAYLKVSIVARYIAHNQAFVGKFGEPSVDADAGVFVVGVEKAREHSRICASASSVICNCEKLEEEQAGVAG